MKHLLNFDTVAEYDAVKDSLEKPYIVTIDENNGLQYNTDVIRVPEGSCGEGDSPFKAYYFDITNVTDEDILPVILSYCTAFGYSEKGSHMVYGHMSMMEFDMEILLSTKAVTKVMFIIGIPVFITEEDTVIIDEALLENFLSAGATPITKEEFYAL